MCVYTHTQRYTHTWLPYVQVCVQRVSALRRALMELLLAHVAQVLPCQLQEGLPSVRQPVQVLRPQQPLLDVPRVPVHWVWRQTDGEVLRRLPGRILTGLNWVKSAKVPRLAPFPQCLSSWAAFTHNKATVTARIAAALSHSTPDRHNIWRRIERVCDRQRLLRY